MDELGNNQQEIDRALQDFDEGFKVQDAPPVAPGAVAPVDVDAPNKTIDFLIRYSGGLIKDENQANYALLTFAVVMFFGSLFFFFRGHIATQQETGPILAPPFIIQQE